MACSLARELNALLSGSRTDRYFGGNVANKWTSTHAGTCGRKIAQTHLNYEVTMSGKLIAAFLKYKKLTIIHHVFYKSVDLFAIAREM